MGQSNGLSGKRSDGSGRPTASSSSPLVQVRTTVKAQHRSRDAQAKASSSISTHSKRTSILALRSREKFKVKKKLVQNSTTPDWLGDVHEPIMEVDEELLKTQTTMIQGPVPLMNGISSKVQVKKT